MHMNVSRRLSNIDITRGIVMIIMAIDHIRDLLHADALIQNPLDFKTTSTGLFLTRWITHLCAPTFVFLSGASVFLAMQNAKDKQKTRSMLWKRGVWLIVLEFTLINFALWFDVHFRVLLLQVIAAIGFGLIVLSRMVYIKTKTIAIIGLAIICLHNVVGIFGLPANPVAAAVDNLLFLPGAITFSPNFLLVIGYPLIPWLGIMFLGFACGRMFQKTSAEQDRLFIRIGLYSLLAFVVLRLVNIYGDPAPWSTQKTGIFTFLSFINVTKYAPSLMFDLLFLGLMFLILAFSTKLPSRIKNILETYGRVPMFYYLLHWFLVRTALFVMVFAQGYHWSELRFGPFQFGRPEKGGGVSLGGVYLVWIVIVVILYPLCKWYSDYKYRHPEKEILKYL